MILVHFKLSKNWLLLELVAINHRHLRYAVHFIDQVFLQTATLFYLINFSTFEEI